MQTIKISVNPPLIGHSGPIREVAVREPTFSEYIRIGDPFTVGASPQTGTPFIVENGEAIAAYIDLLVSPEPMLLEQGGFALAREVKRAILGFFQVGGEAGEASTISAPNSPSTADKVAASMASAG